MKKTVLAFLLMVTVGCGQHSQSLTRASASDPSKEAGETDIKLQTFNAAENGQLEELRALLEEGADINIRNNEGLTLVMAVIRAEQFAILEYLIEENIDLELLTENEEYDPSIDAREYVERKVAGDTAKNIIFRILNQEELNTNDLNKSWYGAVDDFNFGIFRWLLEKGADPNHKVMTGQSGKVKTTPLMYLFSKRGVIDVIDEESKTKRLDFTNLKKMFDLLTSIDELDLNVFDRRKKTALDKAIGREEANPNYTPLVTKLRSLGARTYKEL